MTTFKRRIATASGRGDVTLARWRSLAGVPSRPAEQQPVTRRRSEQTNTLFMAFQERSPRYLDPTASYSNNETPFTYQIYEPLYGYHYLKRPYELVPKAADAGRHSRATSTRPASRLPTTRPATRSPRASTTSRSSRGIMYAPHPAFAKDAQGRLPLPRA